MRERSTIYQVLRSIRRLNFAGIGYRYSSFRIYRENLGSYVENNDNETPIEKCKFFRATFVCFMFCKTQFSHRIWKEHIKCNIFHTWQVV